MTYVASMEDDSGLQGRSQAFNRVGKISAFPQILHIFLKILYCFFKLSSFFFFLLTLVLRVGGSPTCTREIPSPLKFAYVKI